MFKNILVVAPHADDEILGCGATIYKMMQEGHNVYVLIMTNASKSDPNIFSEKVFSVLEQRHWRLIVY